jgi:cysteine synthase A
MLAEKNNWFNPGQYDNVSNPDAHYKWTGPQIWEQTKGKISILSVGLGTTGSAVGISRFLKERNPDIKVIGVSRAANNPVPGVRTSNLLKEIAFDWKSAIGYEEEIGTIESYKMSMELCRLGLFVGPSSGFALAGLLKHLSKSNPNHKEHIAVFVCPDSPFPYIDEYFQYLDDSCFPKIQNEHLLKGKYSNHTSDSLSMISEISSDEVFNLVFGDTNDVWRRIRDKETIAVKEGYTIVDIREEYEYEEHHVPCAINIPFNKIDGYLSKNKSKLMKGEIVFICRHGNMSRLAAYKAEKLGIKSISVKGGDTEWSRLNLPRIRNEKCILRFNLEHNN